MVLNVFFFFFNSMLVLISISDAGPKNESHSFWDDILVLKVDDSIGCIQILLPKFKPNPKLLLVLPKYIYLNTFEFFFACLLFQLIVYSNVLEQF